MYICQIKIKKLLFQILLLSLCQKLYAQEHKLPPAMNFDIGTNAFAIDNNDFGVYFGLGLEYFWNKSFSTEIKGQTGLNSHRLEEPIFPYNLQSINDFVLYTEVSHYSLAIYPRYNQELSDIIYLFADLGFGIESSKSKSTFGNEANSEELFLGSKSTSFKFYPAIHIGIKIIGEYISGSFYIGWEQIDLGRSMNKLEVNHTKIFSNYSKKTEFLQLGFRLSVPLQKEK